MTPPSLYTVKLYNLTSLSLLEGHLTSSTCNCAVLCASLVMFVSTIVAFYLMYCYNSDIVDSDFFDLCMTIDCL